MALDAAGRPGGLRRGLRLEYFTIGWNALEAVVAIAAGLAASSVALLGFGLDSVAESASAAVLIWRFRAEASNRGESERLERRASVLVGAAFLLLAAYVGIRSVWVLATGEEPDPSTIGIALAVVSLIVMPVLAHRKKVLAAAIGSRSLEADSVQTMVCMYLSLFLLVGLGLNAAFGWWWADPVAGLGIAAFAANEGRELIAGEH